MDCETFQALLPVAIAAGSSASDRAMLGEHASGCLPCRRTLEEWEEAQRAMETALGSSKADPRRLQSLSETIYAERFGTALDLKSAAAGVPVAAHAIKPLIIGAAAGILMGYLVWGSGGSNQLVQQLWLLQMLGGGSPAGAMWLPGILGSAGNCVRDVFGMCLIIWLTRSRLWELIFPVNLPKGIHAARLLALPLVVSGVCKIAGDVLVRVSGTSFGLMAPNLAGGLPAMAGVLLLIDTVWRYGFWLLLFLLLFTTVEHIGLQYLRPKESGSRTMQG